MTRFLGALLASAGLVLAGCSSGNTTTPNATPVASVTVTLGSNALAIGDTTLATAIVADSLGAPISGRTVAWTSSAPAVATVNTSGLVVAVAAGTANIVATAGGKSGQAAVSVNPPGPLLSALTLTDASGHPVDVGNVGGTLQLSFQLSAPTATTGTVVVRIDTTEFARQAVSLSRVAPPGNGNASVVTTQVAIDVNTAAVNYTLDAESIDALPLARNGSHILGVEFLTSGSTQPAATAQAAITLANPDVFAARVTIDGPLINLDGKSWSSGDQTIELIPIQYSGSPPQSVTALYADFASDFHGATLTGTAPIATKTGSDVTTPTVLSHTSFQYESPAATGSSLLLSDYSFGSAHYTPQFGEPSAGGNCIYTRSTGLVQRSSVIPPATLPTGCTRWVTVNPIPATLFGPGQFDGSAVRYFDTKGPTIAPGAFTLATRPQVSGQSAYGSFGNFGVASNYISTKYDFSWGIDLNRITDAGSGLDTGHPFALYSGPTPDFVPNAGSLVTDLTTLGTSGASRLRYFGGAWFDRLGNWSYAPLTTNAGNPFTTGNTLSANLGVDPALVGINDDGGTATYGGVGDRFAWHQPDATSLSLSYTVGGSPVGYGTGWAWLRAYQNLDPSRPVYGQDANTATPWVAGGTAGLTPDYSFSLSGLFTLGASKYGGTGEGAYTLFGGVNDLGGAVPAGGTFGPYNIVFDYTAPSAPLIASQSSFVPGATASFDISGSDNVGVGKYIAGWQFNFSNGLFEGGKAYVAFDHKVGSLSSTSLFPTFTATDSQPVPKGFLFFDPNVGSLLPPVYHVSGFAVRTLDLAGNYSPLAVFPIGNNYSSSLPSSPTAIRYSLGGTTACAGTGCTDGSSSTTSVTASWDSPVQGNPLSKFDLFMITDGRVALTAALRNPVETQIGGSYRYTVTGQIDWSKLCLKAGAVNVFGLAETTDHLYFFKPNVFAQMAISVPPVTNPVCLTSPGH